MHVNDKITLGQSEDALVHLCRVGENPGNEPHRLCLAGGHLSPSEREIHGVAEVDDLGKPLQCSEIRDQSHIYLFDRKVSW